MLNVKRLLHANFIPSSRRYIQLSTEDMNNTLSSYVKQMNVAKTFSYFTLMQTKNISPNEKTFLTILPPLIKHKNWDPLFYVLAEMKLANVPIPTHALEEIIIRSNDDPLMRWRTALWALDQLRAISTGDSNITSNIKNMSPKINPEVLSGKVHYKQTNNIKSELMDDGSPMHSLAPISTMIETQINGRWKFSSWRINTVIYCKSGGTCDRPTVDKRFQKIF